VAQHAGAGPGSGLLQAAVPRGTVRLDRCRGPSVSSNMMHACHCLGRKDVKTEVSRDRGLVPWGTTGGLDCISLLPVLFFKSSLLLHSCHEGSSSKLIAVGMAFILGYFH
jgi:hypothetical protein